MHTGTPVPLRLHAAARTHEGFTHTLANRYSAASAHSFRMSSSLASGFNSVWSTSPAQSRAVAASPSTSPIRAAPASNTRCIRSGHRLKHSDEHPHIAACPSASPFNRATMTSVICSTRRSKSPLFEIVMAEFYHLYCRSTASILATRFLWRSSVISVESQAATMSRISFELIVPLPRVRTLASLCSRQLTATLTE